MVAQPRKGKGRVERPVGRHDDAAAVRDPSFDLARRREGRGAGQALEASDDGDLSVRTLIETLRDNAAPDPKVRGELSEKNGLA